MMDLELPLDFDDADTSTGIPVDPSPGRDFPISNRKTSLADFRTQHFLRGLSPQRRAEIARRPRFYTIPFIHPASQPDDDQLP